MDINERKKIIHFGKRLIETGLSFGSGGNLSTRVGEEDFLITPSGMAYDGLKERDLVVMNGEGAIVKGERKPSSEWHMHGAIYARRPDIRALVHTHSRYISVLSTLGEGLPPISYLIASAGVSTVPLAGYETFGTEALAREAARALGDEAKAVILSNHGLIAGGEDLESAFSLAEDLEFCAFMYITALSTGREIQLIPEEKIQEVIEKFKSYGQ